MKTYLWNGRLLAVAGLLLCPNLHADVVTDWNANLEQALKTGLVTTPPIQARAAALVQAAVYDAVNGIDQKYQPYFVTESAPPGARDDAAAVAAAYTALVGLFPAQQSTLDAQFATSLASLPGIQGNSKSMALGLMWGTHVANAILAWRSTDGIARTTTPYYGGTAPGIWRSLPTATAPDGSLPAAFQQLATLLPFAIPSPSAYRPGPPPALTSDQYAADVNEIHDIGGAVSTVRTPTQTATARLWAAVDIADENNVARQVLPPDAELVDNARILALANITLADCLTASFDCKTYYNLWRPYHAIHLADTDGNPLTAPDLTWLPLIPTPRFQEYVSNHAILTGGFMRALADIVGDEHTFVLSSPGFPSFTITYNRLSDAAEEVKFARMWGGMHYRNSVNVGHEMGVTIADYVVSNFLQPLGDAGDTAE